MSNKEQSIFLSNESGEGFGKFTFPDGDMYEGEFKDWDMNGQGTYTWTNGDKYVGEHKNSKLHGHGELTKSDGTKYVGEFKNGEVDGQGTYISHDGRKFEGEWKDGREWNGTGYDKNGNITGKYVNGILQEHSLKQINPSSNF